MADLWSHQFCLACDKQVETDLAAYCSESCRLAELEKTSTPSSQASSPGLTPSSYPWTTSASQTSSVFDFSKPKAFANTIQQQTLFGNYTMEAEAKAMAGQTISPSSSHTSLCSIQSTSTTSDNSQLSDRARQELRAYAVSFEHVRSQRRRSY